MGEWFEKAAWIMADDGDMDAVEHRFYIYKASFRANAGDTVTFAVGAFSQYALWVNGVFANAGIFEDYEFHPVYDTLDISALVVDGENEIELGQYVAGHDFLTRSKGTPGVIFSVLRGEEHLLDSSSEIMSARDARYLDKHELISGQLAFNFEFDARAGALPMRKSKAVDKPRVLCPRPIEKLTVGEVTSGKRVAQGTFLEKDANADKAVRMYEAYLSARNDNFVRSQAGEVSLGLPDGEKADGVYLVYDLGGETAGYLELSVDVPEGTEILVGFGEHLDDLRPRTYIGQRNFCVRFVAKAGENAFFYPYQRLGLRYLQLHIYAKNAVVKHCGVRPTDYPLTVYPCPMSDGLHKRIYDVGVKTLRMCMHEHYEDCPWREQALYGMDSRIQILCGYYAFREFRFPRASLALLARSYRERDNLLELTSPGRTVITIPSFTAVFLREVYEYTLYSGDLTLAEELLPTLKAIAEGFLSRIDGKTGLIPLYTGSEHWNFYEWREGLEGSERHADGKVIYEAPLCAFVADALECFGKVLEKLGRDGGRYTGKAAALKEAAEAAFYDEATGLYRTRYTDAAPKHELTQAMLLYTGCIPEDKVGRAEEALLDGSLVPVSLSMTVFAYEALMRGGRHAETVLRVIEERWGKMIARGADTFWETDLGADDFHKAGSLCHGWSAGPVYLFGRYFSKDIYADRV